MYIEKVATFGLGYLVYKRIMSELAQEPDKEGVMVKAGQLLGWDRPEQFEEGIRLWAGGTGKLTGDIKLMKRGEYAELYGTEARKERITGGQWSWLGEGERLGEFGEAIKTGYTFLPEGFELTGPSRTGITRPKGLD